MLNSRGEKMQYLRGPAPMAPALIVVVSSIAAWVLRRTHARIDRSEAAIAMLQASKADDSDLKEVFHELREMRMEMNTGFLYLIERIKTKR
jgi:hypothetical protein